MPSHGGHKSKLNVILTICLRRNRMLLTIGFTIESRVRIRWKSITCKKRQFEPWEQPHDTECAALVFSRNRVGHDHNGGPMLSRYQRKHVRLTLRCVKYKINRVVFLRSIATLLGCSGATHQRSVLSDGYTLHVRRWRRLCNRPTHHVYSSSVGSPIARGWYFTIESARATSFASIEAPGLDSFVLYAMCIFNRLWLSCAAFASTSAWPRVKTGADKRKPNNAPAKPKRFLIAIPLKNSRRG
jgi:hypothetical protein